MELEETSNHCFVVLGSEICSSNFSSMSSTLAAKNANRTPQHEQEGPTVIFCDNKVAISMTKNLMFHSQIKHIDIRFHFIRDLVVKEEVSLSYFSTHKQWADILTKALSKEKFCYFRAMMGINKFESRGSIEE